MDQRPNLRQTGAGIKAAHAADRTCLVGTAPTDTPNEENPLWQVYAPDGVHAATRKGEAAKSAVVIDDRAAPATALYGFAERP